MEKFGVILFMIGLIISFTVSPGAGLVLGLVACLMMEA